MAEDNDGLGEAINMRRNSEETHMEMRKNVKSKLAKYHDPLLEVPSEEKYHWLFYLMLDPSYFNELGDVRKLHEIENLDTRTIINEMMPKFYDYIVAGEWEEEPCTDAAF